jgi:hypothetical protein
MRHDDVFHDRGIWLVLACLAVLALVSCIGLGIIYFGDSFAVPAWSEHSMPAPRP